MTTRWYRAGRLPVAACFPLLRRRQRHLRASIQSSRLSQGGGQVVSESAPKAAAGQFVLTPPDFSPPVPPAGAGDLVKLDDGLKSRVEAQAEAFVRGLMTADIHGDDF